MAIEFDIEDIIGAGCLSSIGRAVATLSCLWLGAATGSLAVQVAEGILEALARNPPEPAQFLGRILLAMAWGPFLIFRSVLIPLFFPLVLLVYFKFARGDGGSMRSWLVYAAISGALVFMSMHAGRSLGAPGTGLAVFLWVGFVGSLAMMGYVLAAWQRRRLVVHLNVLAAENSARRRELAEQFGTATGDREFATGEAGTWVAPREPEHRHPQVPRPPRGEEE